MHQKNSNHVGSHHVEGFQDCFMYKEDRYAKTIDTSDESPCTMVSTTEMLLTYVAGNGGAIWALIAGLK